MRTKKPTKGILSPLAQARDALSDAFESKVRASLKTLYFPEIWYILENWFALSKSKRVLEVGYGIGLLSEALAKSDWQIEVVDPSSTALDDLKANFAREQLEGTFTQGALDALPFEDHSFDYIVCVNTLECSASPDKTVAEISRTLSPGGRAVLVTFNKLSPWGVPAVFRALRKISRAQPLNFMTRDEFVQTIRRHKLTVESIKERACYLPAATRMTKLKLPFPGAFVALVSKNKEPVQ